MFKSTAQKAIIHLNLYDENIYLYTKDNIIM